jgi:hypothetical protein
MGVYRTFVVLVVDMVGIYVILVAGGEMEILEVSIWKTCLHPVEVD